MLLLTSDSTVGLRRVTLPSWLMLATRNSSLATYPQEDSSYNEIGGRAE